VEIFNLFKEYLVMELNVLLQLLQIPKTGPFFVLCRYNLAIQKRFLWGQLQHFSPM